MNTQVLQDRIDEAKKEIDFYVSAVEMLIQKYFIQQYLTLTDMKQKFPKMPEEVLEVISKGEMPTEEMMNTISIHELDVFIQDSIALVGSILGISWLQEQDNEDTEEYIEMLMVFQTEDETILQALGFGSLSLAMERPPSGAFLERMFPLSEDKETNQTSVDCISEMNSDLVMKWRRDKPLIHITRDSL